MNIEPTIYDYWRMLVKRKWIGLTVYILVFIASVIHTNMQVSLYRTEASLRYEPPNVQVVGSDVGPWDQIVAMNTQIRILTSADLAGKVAKRLGYAPPGISAFLIKDTRLLGLSCAGPDPKIIVDTLNAAIEIYMEQDRELWSRSERQALEDITSRRERIESQLIELEEAKREYLEKNPTLGADSHLSDMYLDLDLKKRDLMKKFTPDHPEIVAINNKLEEYQARLASMPTRDLEIERFAREIDVTKDIFMSLSRQLEEKKVALAAAITMVSIVTKPALPRAPFYPNKKSSLMVGMIFGVAVALAAILLVENLDISISTIEEIETVLGIPVLGVIPHMGAVNPLDALRARFGRRVKETPETFRSLLLIHQTQKDSTLEFYHSLRSSIFSRTTAIPRRVLTFTSAGMAEGKTLTAANFCLAAARSGIKTLLIGADARRSVLDKMFGLPKQRGLIDILSGKIGWEEACLGVEDLILGDIPVESVLKYKGIGNLRVMPSSAAPDIDINSLLSSPKLIELIAEIRENFELVIFDCPPVLLFADSMLISAHTDGVIFIYQSGKISRQALRRAKDQLVEAHANIIGVALNDMRYPDPTNYYYNYYGYGDNDAHGNAEKADSGKEA